MSFFTKESEFNWEMTESNRKWGLMILMTIIIYNVNIIN